MTVSWNVTTDLSTTRVSTCYNVLSVYQSAIYMIITIINMPSLLYYTFNTCCPEGSWWECAQSLTKGWTSATGTGNRPSVATQSQDWGRTHAAAPEHVMQTPCFLPQSPQQHLSCHQGHQGQSILSCRARHFSGGYRGLVQPAGCWSRSPGQADECRLMAAERRTRWGFRVATLLVCFWV